MSTSCTNIWDKRTLYVHAARSLSLNGAGSVMALCAMAGSWRRWYSTAAHITRIRQHGVAMSRSTLRMYWSFCNPGVDSCPNRYSKKHGSFSFGIMNTWKHQFSFKQMYFSIDQMLHTLFIEHVSNMYQTCMKHVSSLNQRAHIQSARAFVTGSSIQMPVTRT